MIYIYIHTHIYIYLTPAQSSSRCGTAVKFRKKRLSTQHNHVLCNFRTLYNSLCCMCGQMAGEAWGQLGRLDIRRTSAQKLALWRCIAQVDTPLRHWCASAHQHCTQLHEPEAALIKCADGASAETMSSMLSSSKSVGFGVGAPSIPWAKRHLLTPGRVKRRRMSGNLQIRRRIGQVVRFCWVLEHTKSID